MIWCDNVAGIDCSAPGGSRLLHANRLRSPWSATFVQPKHAETKKKGCFSGRRRIIKRQNQCSIMQVEVVSVVVFWPKREDDNEAIFRFWFKQQQKLMWGCKMLALPCNGMPLLPFHIEHNFLWNFVKTKFELFSNAASESDCSPTTHIVVWTRIRSHHQL